ncbi:MAG: peptidyl-tRNA hydrolase [Candidatus Bathyarchaeota archaeon]|nr:MAG: peptidyl-tRNA hydrolase [Candidatus Bathyarchaeota archaeon]
MCIVLRTDLRMSAGKQIAQACHAAVGASEKAKRENHRAWMRWRDEGGKKVALEAESLEELEELVKRADELDIVNVIIQDAGLTEVPPGTVTALGLGPEMSEKLDKVTGSLPLIK